jgi:Dolichyl-phosphate-mannose-protein mannosyltransferase
MRSYLIALSAIILLKAFVMIGLISFGGIGLGPDEAQYWTWSQFLDWGYYSKPPGIAWQIWLGTKLFGNTELGVRFFSVVLSALLSYAVYLLALCCKTKPSTAFWAGVVMALSPLGVMASFLAITDIGMVLFWAFACCVVAKALSDKQTPNYYLLGLLILCGALFKWPIYLFWILLIAFMPLYRHLRSKHLFGGIFISLFGLLPSLFWNATHQWVTFKHVFTTVSGGHAHEEGATFLYQGNFFDFIGAQASLLSPILFLILLASFIYLIKRNMTIEPGLFFCGASSLMILSIFAVLSIFHKMQGNWCDFVYPTAIVFLCWNASESKIWLKFGVTLSVIMCVFMYSIPYIQSHSILSQYQVPYKINPFRHNLGWDHLHDHLIEAGYNNQKHFLFGDKYQMSSILSFYGPGQKRAYFLNLQNNRLNQFSFWPNMSHEQVGKTGFFVISENIPHLARNQNKIIEQYQTDLQVYFQKVEFLGVKPIFNCYGAMCKDAIIFRCINYNGKEPVGIPHY